MDIMGDDNSEFSTRNQTLKYSRVMCLIIVSTIDLIIFILIIHAMEYINFGFWCLLTLLSLPTLSTLVAQFERLCYNIFS